MAVEGVRASFPQAIALPESEVRPDLMLRRSNELPKTASSRQDPVQARVALPAANPPDNEHA